MKLYYSPGACSLGPHILLSELGAPYETESVDLRSHKSASGDYYAVNPKGQVPAIRFNTGDLLTEAAVILQAIADQRPDMGFLPKTGTAERWHALEWLNFCATELHKGFGALWHQSPEPAQTNAKENLKKKFAFVAARLKDREYLMGSKFTAPDAYMFTMLRWAHHHKVDMSGSPELDAYFKRIDARPAVQKALKDEGLKH